MEYITRGPCGQEGCRETRYYLDSGIWFCRRGHQQEGRQIEEDPEDFGKLGRISRVKRAPTEKIQKTFRGKEAFRLFVHAYQYVLWMQCHALVHGKGYPADLEVVVRDLWALRLRSLVKKLDELPEGEDDAQASSSQAASDTEGEVDDTREQFMPRRASSTPRLVETLGLCYLGCLLLRLPTSVGDIYRLAMGGDIPYIRVVRSLPNDIKDRLPQEYLRQFDTPYLLTNERLHEVVNHLIIMYHGAYGTEFPPLNAPLLLVEYIRQLSLPLEVYTVVRKLNQMLRFAYDFPLSSKATLRNLGFPELRLMAQLVVATKLVLPFDNITRFPSSPSEPAAQSLDWKRWSEVRDEFSRRKSEGKIAKGRHILLEEDDVFDLTPEQLDDYMDWYETRWIDTSKSPNPIAEMFRWTRPEASAASSAADPRGAGDDTNEILASVINSLRPVKPVKKKDRREHLQPGTSYQQYQSEVELPETGRKFYEAAAEICGISLRSLVRAVVQVEVKLQDWQEDWRRAVYHGLVEESSSEEEVGEETVLEPEK